MGFIKTSDFGCDEPKTPHATKTTARCIPSSNRLYLYKKVRRQRKSGVSSKKRAEREEADFMRQFPSLQIKKDYYSSWFAVDEATMCPKSLVKMDHVMGGNDDKKRERIKSEEPTVRILDKFHCRFCSNDKKWIIQRHLSERDT